MAIKLLDKPSEASIGPATEKDAVESAAKMSAPKPDVKVVELVKPASGRVAHKVTIKMPELTGKAPTTEAAKEVAAPATPELVRAQTPTGPTDSESEATSTPATSPESVTDRWMRLHTVNGVYKVDSHSTAL